MAKRTIRTRDQLPQAKSREEKIEDKRKQKQRILDQPLIIGFDLAIDQSALVAGYWDHEAGRAFIEEHNRSYDFRKRHAT